MLPAKSTYFLYIEGNKAVHTQIIFQCFSSAISAHCEILVVTLTPSFKLQKLVDDIEKEGESVEVLEDKAEAIRDKISQPDQALLDQNVRYCL